MSSIVPYDPYAKRQLLIDENSSPKRIKVASPANLHRISKKKVFPEDFDLKISIVIRCILDNDRSLGVRVNLLNAWFDHQNLPIPEKLRFVTKSIGLVNPVEGDNILHLAIRINDSTLVRLIIAKGYPKPHEQNAMGETAYQVASTMSDRYKNKKIIDALRSCKVDYLNLNFSRLTYIQNFISSFKELVEIFISKNKGFESNNTFVHLFFSFKTDSMRRNINSIEYLLSLNPDLTLENDQNLTPYELAILNFPRPAFCILIDYMKLKGQKIKELEYSHLQKTIVDPNNTFNKITSYLVAQRILTFKDIDLDDSTSAKINTYLNFKDQAAVAQTCYHGYDQVNEWRWKHLKSFKFDCNKHLATQKLADLFYRVKHITGQTHRKDMSNLSVLFGKFENFEADHLSLILRNNGGDRGEYEYLKLMFKDKFKKTGSQ